MILPFWNSELHVEMSRCFPFGRDYHPATLSRFYDDTLKQISESCMDLGGEFFFMASPKDGCVGNLSRENFYKFQPDASFSLGFILTLGYSDMLEKVVIASLMIPEAQNKLKAGITACSMWSRGIFEGVTKAIAVVSDEPFFDAKDYLRGFAALLDSLKKMTHSTRSSYYAEKFGYDRFFIAWEDDKPIDIAISQTIAEFELDSTKEIIGGGSVADFPPFMGATVSVMNASVLEE